MHIIQCQHPAVFAIQKPQAEEVAAQKCPHRFADGFAEARGLTFGRPLLGAGNGIAMQFIKHIIDCFIRIMQQWLFDLAGRRSEDEFLM